MNHFNIIGLEQRYDIDKVRLEENYIKLQNQYHPDKIMSSESDDKDSQLYKALEINTAYNILSDDLKRAIYILKTYNFDIEDESQKIPIDQTLLNEIFFEREYIENLTDKNLLKNALSNNNKKIEDIKLKLIGLFDQNQYLEALKLTVKFKYLENIKKLIIKKLR